MSAGRVRVALGLWVLLLAATVTLSILSAGHDTLPGDVGIATWAQGLPFPGERLSDLVRAITGTEVVLATGGALAIVLLLRGQWAWAGLLVVGLVLLAVLQPGVKELVDRPRPTPDLVELRGSFSSSSFPSGHVMSGTYLYGFILWLALRLRPPLAVRWLAVTLSLLLLAFSGPANVYLGVHWPSDVLGGYGWALVILAPLVAASILSKPPDYQTTGALVPGDAGDDAPGGDDPV
jgi:undecaprenyl-diphosphatase